MYRRRMRAAWLLIALALTGCSASVKLQHPDGRVAKCGPYVWLAPAVSAGVPEREGRCISDFQRQGYERVAD